MINPALKDFFHYPARIKTLYGGRSSSKTHSVAEYVVQMARKYPIRIMVVRQFQNRIQESFFIVLKDKINSLSLQDEFTITATGITHNATGAEFIFFGIARNLEEIKGAERIAITVLEEMTSLTQKQWEIIYPTLIRVENGLIFVLFNPRFFSDFAYQFFIVNPPSNSISRKINYTENPFLSEDVLTSIEDERKRDEANYSHIYLGEPKESSDNAIFQRKWVNASVDFATTITGADFAGVDPAGEGEDNYVLCHRTGITVCHLEAIVKESEVQSARAVHRYMTDRSITSLAYDAGGGFGGVLKSEVERLSNTIVTNPINFGGKVPDATYGESQMFGNEELSKKDLFFNYKAMMFWELADRFRKTWEHTNNIKSYPIEELISLQLEPSILTILTDELCSLEYRADSEGKIQMESKKDLRKRINKSPDYADALAVSFEGDGYFNYGGML